MNPILQEAFDAIQSATEGMTEEQLLFHPEGKWCSAEVLEHLSLSYSGTAKVMDKCLKEGKPLGGRPTLKQRLQHFVVLDIGYFPSGRKAPKHVVPSGGIGGKAAVEQIFADFKRMAERHAECEKKFGNSGPIADHPVLGPLDALQWAKFHRVHALHHMKQIARLRAAQA